MQIFVNGSPRGLTAPMTVTELLAELGLSERRLAVEVNREIVPKSRHAKHCLQDGDHVELVQAMGGG
jgi:sulfur carrier protein